MHSTAWLLNSSYISFPTLLWSFCPKISELWHFIISKSLLPSSIQPAFILPWFKMLGIRREACRCYWFQHHTQDIKILSARVRFECSAKPKEGFEHLIYPCSGPALLGHGITFLLVHGRMKWKPLNFFRDTCRFTSDNKNSTTSGEHDLGLNSLQKVLPALHFIISGNIFIRKSYCISFTCSFESLMLYLLFYFILFQSLK